MQSAEVMQLPPIDRNPHAEIIGVTGAKGASGTPSEFTVFSAPRALEAAQSPKTVKTR